MGDASAYDPSSWFADGDPAADVRALHDQLTPEAGAASSQAGAFGAAFDVALQVDGAPALDREALQRELAERCDEWARLDGKVDKQRTFLQATEAERDRVKARIDEITAQFDALNAGEGE